MMMTVEEQLGAVVICYSALIQSDFLLSPLKQKRGQECALIKENKARFTMKQ